MRNETLSFEINNKNLIINNLISQILNFTKDFNNNGLISGQTYYQLLGDDGAKTLKLHNSHSGWNDDSSNRWNVTAAKNNSSDFQVLFAGEGSTNGSYFVVTTDANGIYSTSTEWMTTAETVSAGYENTIPQCSHICIRRSELFHTRSSKRKRRYLLTLWNPSSSSKVLSTSSRKDSSHPSIPQTL